MTPAEDRSNGKYHSARLVCMLWDDAHISSQDRHGFRDVTRLGTTTRRWPIFSSALDLEPDLESLREPAVTASSF